MGDEYDPAYPTYDAENDCSKEKSSDNNVMKPEKVKSRWRRCSELEGEDIDNRTKLLESCYQKIPVFDEKESSVMKTESKLKNLSDSISEDRISETSQNPSEEIKDKIPFYDSLEENQYLFERKRTKRKKEVRRMLCDCTLTKAEQDRGVKGCEDECLNRLLMIECGSRCATGDACSNKRFQKRLYAKAMPFKTDKKGWGLKLLEDVHVGHFVIEYCGEVLSRQEFKQRVKQYAREKSNHYYFMALKCDEIIDATNKGNLSRFINHSCDPNCETQKWTVNGELRIGFFAKRELKVGEELTFDYQFQRYGREAQKCYCESDICSGYIGVSKQITLEVNTCKNNFKRKKVVEEKKREGLEDLMVEDEIEKLFEIGGLRNREETLVLARLMLRAEDIHSRIKVLDIILGTTELACLRLFLDYHGLSLLWSWMVDVVDIKLKTKILQVLSVLPVPNKTMLLDSKVLSIVQKWLAEMPLQNPMPPIGHSMNNSRSFNLTVQSQSNNELKSKVKLSETSDIGNEIDCTSFQISDSQTKLNKLDSTKQHSNTLNDHNHFKRDISPINKRDSSSMLNSDDLNKVSRSDEESGDILGEDGLTKISNEFINLASNLLDSWKDLNEVFRIPRLEQQKRREDEREADRYGKRNEIYKHYNFQRIVSKHRESRRNYSNWDSNHFSKGKNYKRETRRRFRYPPVISDEVYHFAQERMEGRKAIPGNFEDIERPRKVLLPTPKCLSKAERRHLFEIEVQQRDHEEALKKQIETAPIESFSSDANKPSAFDQYFSDSTSYGDSYIPNATYSPQVSLESELSSVGNNLPSVISSEQGSSNSYTIGLNQSVRQVLLPTPDSVDSTLTNGTAIYSSNVAYHPNISFPATTSAILSQETIQPITMCQSSQPEVNHNQAHSSFIRVGGMNTTNAVPPIVSNDSKTNMSSFNPSMPATPIAAVQACENSVSSPVVTAYFSNQGPTINNQMQQVYYVQPHYSTSQLSEQVCVSQSIPQSAVNGVELSSPLQNFIRLPPNWKTATDAEGNIYYYHVITREAQWDPPETEEIGEDGDSGTPTFDEPKLSKKKSTTTAPADTSCNTVPTDIAKKIKELFRTKMSSFIVQCLNPYRKPDCALGRIISTEDFKHLARKLTHFVMAKELKHCKNVEELECNENVKHKAKDFVQKYMAKYGPFYRKEKGSPFGS